MNNALGSFSISRFLRPIRKVSQRLCSTALLSIPPLKNTSKIADDVWWRGIADLVIIDEEEDLAWVIDYKTGKSARYADKGQLELMALAVFKFFPNIKTVRGGLLFVVSNELIKGNYVSLDQGHLWEKWLGGYTKLETAFKNDVWNPNPSGLCRAHCLVLECEHNGRRS